MKNPKQQNNKDVKTQIKMGIDEPNYNSQKKLKWKWVYEVFTLTSKEIQITTFAYQTSKDKKIIFTVMKDTLRQAQSLQVRMLISLIFMKSNLAVGLVFLNFHALWPSYSILENLT